MGKINVGRLILGGIVAGIAIDLIDYFVDGVWLAKPWADGMALLGHPGFSQVQIILFNVIGILTGIAAIWVYAAIRPRFGAGMMTAFWAGVAVWVIGILLPNTAMMHVTHLFSNHLTLYTTLGGFVEVVVGTIAGASVYREA
ncbi:MAG TPA: hypothetical protein VMT38_09790 [Terracidiphilus sp.]|nr:hypothetical protein [Terracidiphilus sp.]